MCEFSRKDVLEMAENIVEYAEISQYQGSCKGWEVQCIFCDEEETWDKKTKSYVINHTIDCPVLIARDVLTREDE